MTLTLRRLRVSAGKSTAKNVVVASYRKGGRGGLGGGGAGTTAELVETLDALLGAWEGRGAGAERAEVESAHTST